MYSFAQSDNECKCPFCNFDRASKTDGEIVADMMKRTDANDAASIYMLGTCYRNGLRGLQQDRTKAIELYARAGQLGCSKSHTHLGVLYHEGGDMKKAKFHFEAAAMAGHDVARSNLGVIEFTSGNLERAVKHWTIGASVGNHEAMNFLIKFFEKGHISCESINSTLAAYNNSCAEVRSEARDACIRSMLETD